MGRDAARDLRNLLAEAFRSTLRELDPAAAVRRAFLRLRTERSPVASAVVRARRLRVLALGKASPAMLRGALDALGAGALFPSGPVVAALVVAPDGTPAELPAWVPVLRAAHPVPDERSLEAAHAALAFARGAGDALLVLLSGGASALAAAPRGISLVEKQRLTDDLLRSGAPIADLNVVRRHLSWIKGGGLARAAAPRPVLTLALSDVLAGGPHDIGSGPSVPDPTTVDDARRALAVHVPRARDLPLRPSLGPFTPAARRTKLTYVGSPRAAALALAEALRRTGLVVRVLPPSQADVGELALEYRSLARELPPGEAVVRAAEPSLRVPAKTVGRGGRASHLALALASELPEGTAFLAGASDGADGTSAGAGAVVDAHVLGALSKASVEAALHAFDSAALLESQGALLRTGPTGVNVADLHALVRAAAV